MRDDGSAGGDTVGVAFLRIARRVSLISLLLCSVACSRRSDLETTSLVAQNVLNGEDDREELFQLPDALAERIGEVSASLMYSHHVHWMGDGNAEIRSSSAVDSWGLCTDEAYATQPSAAFCSGVLVDGNLVLTAGHCVDDDVCRQSNVVFGFGYSERDSPLRLSADDVFSCRRVVKSSDGDGDYAIVELDRSATRLPILVGSRRVTVGQQVVVASNGVGLPLKCERSARVETSDIENPFFTAATDTFEGSSGGAILSESLELVGIVVAGTADWESTGECRRARHATSPLERHQHASSIVELFCSTGYPSISLCNRSQKCGDGICSSRESCAMDCPPPSCGDGICELPERDECRQDCRRFSAVPSTWPLAPERYLEWHHVTASDGHSDGCTVTRTRQVGDGRSTALEIFYWLLFGANLCGRSAMARLRRRRRTEMG